MPEMEESDIHLVTHESGKMELVGLDDEVKLEERVVYAAQKDMTMKRYIVQRIAHNRAEQLIGQIDHPELARDRNLGNVLVQEIVHVEFELAQRLKEL